MPEKTRIGCNIEKDFMMSPDGEDFGYFMALRDNGYMELYYSAPYYWGVIHPEKKKIVSYTEGDVYKIDCPTEKLLLEEAQDELKFVKKNYSDRVVWAEGEDTIKKLKNRMKG
jgi:hypothetical protein